MRRDIVVFGFGIGLAIGFAALGSGASPLQRGEIAKNSEAPGVSGIKDLLESGGTNAGLNMPELRRFYERRDFAPAWNTSGANLAIAASGSSAEDGLDPAAYRLDAILARKNAPTARNWSELDLFLTNSVLAYMHDLHVGRVSPDSAGFAVALPSTGYDAVAALTDALASGRLAELFGSLAPPHPEYARLKVALAQYRKIAEDGGWPQIASFTSLDLQSADTRISLLRRRLAIEDSLMNPNDASIENVEAAVKRFQARSGLEADGRVGKITLAALNVPASARVAQIIANMERWRWLPRPFEDTYVEVNAADATLKVVDHGKVVLTSKVITGKPASPTPIFKAEIEAVIVNPSWNIPDKIAREEILPKEHRHPGYMARQHIVADRPGGRLRQLPGEGNSLGRLKLEMPNRFDSYLHDTPAQSLFAQADRHFSHGCMRVEQIQPLASFAMSGDAQAGLERIRDAIATEVTQRFSVDKPIPVYVLYWTVIADQDGTVEFRPDVYGRDEKLLARLGGQRPMGRVSMLSDCSDARRG